MVFDDEFTTVDYIQSGYTPPNWDNLFKNKAEKATEEDFALEEQWHVMETNNNSNSK